MEELYLPVLSHFQNGNEWSGSGGNLRYRISPDGEQMIAEVCEGPWCYALSRVEERRVFPMEEERLAEISAWLAGWLEPINARPKKNLEETLRLRDAVAAEKTIDPIAAAEAE